MNAPVIPPISYQDVLAQADTFDVLLFQGTSQMSQGIEFFTAGAYSHAAMVFRPSPDQPPLIWQTSIEAIVDDVLDKDRPMHAGSQLNAMDSAMSVILRGYADFPYYRRYVGPRTPEQRNAAAEFVAQHDAIPFGTLEDLVKNWIAARLGRITVPKEVFCAELVAMTFNAAGLLGDEHPPTWYSPSSWSQEKSDVSLTVGHFDVEQLIDLATIPATMEPLQPPSSH